MADALVALPGGEFTMGSDDHYPEERPAHRRRVEPFEFAAHPVTNAQFAAFVDATGYVTVAEQAPDPADFPGADPADLVPGGLVFTPSSGPVDLRDWSRWWRWQPGADWRHPLGPSSSIEAKADHPVVQVCFVDATAYAAWAGLRLPTETEWEFAARGGLEAREYAWGDELHPDGAVLANTWLGDFPYRSTGWGGTSPVGSYPANDWGLVDLIGNVWEWTADPHTPRHDAAGVDIGQRRDLLSPSGRPDAFRVTKGGSHLCAPEYCRRYRPAARSPQSEDSATSHLGFRCAR